MKFIDFTDDYFQGKQVLITGGLGFIGSNLALRLKKAGAKVTIIDALFHEYGGNLFNIQSIQDEVDVYNYDIRQTYRLHRLVEGKDYLFSLAGQCSHMESMQDPMTDLQINAEAHLGLLEVCREWNPGIRMVYAGTRQVYGVPDYTPVDEKHPLRPVDVNGVHKLAADHYHLLYSKVYGLHASVLRLTNTVGPRMRICDSRQTFIGIWIRRMLEKKPFEVWGGAQMRDFTYVEDVVDALMRAVVIPEASGEVFNLGGLPPISLKELAELMILMDKDASYTTRSFPVDRSKIDIGDYYSDDRKIRNKLGWNPTNDWESILSKTYKYYKENGEHYL